VQRQTTWLAIGALAVSFAVATIFTTIGCQQVSPPEQTHYTVRGIDVSHHQGAIDWRRVARTHVQFAYLKASEGGDWRDASFGANLQGAKRAAIATGAYHFFTFCAPGGAQAHNFLSTAPVEATVLPPAVDLEYVGNCAGRPARDAFTRELRNFLHIIEARYHRTPALYTARSFFDNYLRDKEFARYPLWIRDLTGLEAMPAKRTVLFRQFSDNGTIDGIRKFVDEDLFVGSKEDFAGLLLSAKRSLAH
jgi:lysozyme